MENIGIEPYQLLTQVINFALMIFILTKLLYKPILKGLEERKKKIEEGLEKFREIDKMRRKKMFVDQDVAGAGKDIADMETKLKTIYEELKKLYETRKVFQSMTKRGVKVGGFKEDITLGDIGIIEMEG